MPFQINLDTSILETVAEFPYILGNLMMNDYIRGLDPEDVRIEEQRFLSMFNDDHTNSERDHMTRRRSITQHSANEEGYASDARGAGLVYSKWLNKWYLGFGRLNHVFRGLFENIGPYEDPYG